MKHLKELKNTGDQCMCTCKNEDKDIRDKQISKGTDKMERQECETRENRSG